MEKQVRLHSLFQRGAKCLDQLMRQVANKTYGIGNDSRAIIFQINTSQCRIESRKQLIRRIGMGFGHLVKQR